MPFVISGSGEGRGLEAAPERRPEEATLLIPGSGAPEGVSGPGDSDGPASPLPDAAAASPPSPHPHPRSVPAAASLPPRHLRGRSDPGLCPAPQPRRPAWRPPSKHS